MCVSVYNNQNCFIVVYNRHAGLFCPLFVHIIFLFSISTLGEGNLGSSAHKGKPQVVFTLWNHSASALLGVQLKLCCMLVPFFHVWGCQQPVPKQVSTAGKFILYSSPEPCSLNHIVIARCCCWVISYISAFLSKVKLKQMKIQTKKLLRKNRKRIMTTTEVMNRWDPRACLYFYLVFTALLLQVIKKSPDL